jgi:hypothetical protein
LISDNGQCWVHFISLQARVPILSQKWASQKTNRLVVYKNHRESLEEHAVLLSDSKNVEKWFDGLAVAGAAKAMWKSSIRIVRLRINADVGDRVHQGKPWNVLSLAHGNGVAPTPNEEQQEADGDFARPITACQLLRQVG